MSIVESIDNTKTYAEARFTEEWDKGAHEILVLHVNYDFVPERFELISYSSLKDVLTSEKLGGDILRIAQLADVTDTFEGVTVLG